MKRPRVLRRADMLKKVRRPKPREDRRCKPRLHVSQVLEWAKRHRRETGAWPTKRSGEVIGVPFQTWYAVEKALEAGLRGLPKGLTIVRLLTKRLGVRNERRPPPLTIAQILRWADAHRSRTGEWPAISSAPIPRAPGENWKQISLSLSMGRRGLPTGWKLTTLLHHYRGARNKNRPPPLTVAQILRWADAHRARTGSWPTRNSGEIPSSGGENWKLIDADLQTELRGLRRWTLHRLLHKHRGAPLYHSPRPLSEALILRWADAHRRRTGAWPNCQSGRVLSVKGESWGAINASLERGQRGLAGGSSLITLLNRERGVRNRNRLPLLEVATVLRWAEEHRSRTGRWPTEDSGAIAGSGGETWCGVVVAFRLGRRGMKAGSLSKLLRGGGVGQGSGGLRSRGNAPTTSVVGSDRGGRLPNCVVRRARYDSRS